MKNDVCDTIAILDSGIGGISILKQLIKKYKAGNYIYFADNQFMPYGNKDKVFVKDRVNEIIEFLKTRYKANKIIIACNTASTCLYGNLDKTIEILNNVCYYLYVWLNNSVHFSNLHKDGGI